MSFDLSSVLHAGRTALLSATHAEGAIVVSVGAAGQWYFDWIDATCGAPARHIGVEYYVAPPPTLPSNVEWVANTAGHMPGVETGSADILISGQNIEHLWEEEVSGFILEAHRILRPGGKLLMDSPNRTITALYGGAHPEHMVELTVAEAVSLVTAAGFDVTRVAGVLQCRDAKTGELWPNENLTDPSGQPLVFRVMAGMQDPENAYLWWIEATRAERDPDVGEVKSVIARYWAEGWPERMDRMVTAIGQAFDAEDGRPSWQSGVGQSGPLAFGPYAPVKAGRYRSTVEVMRTTRSETTAVLGHVDILFDGSDDTLCHVSLTADLLPWKKWVPISLEFEIEEMRFGFQNRIFSYGEAGLAVVRHVALERLDG